MESERNFAGRIYWRNIESLLINKKFLFFKWMRPSIATRCQSLHTVLQPIIHLVVSFVRDVEMNTKAVLSSIIVSVKQHCSEHGSILYNLLGDKIIIQKSP